MLRSQKRRLETLETRLCLTTAIGFAQHDIDEAPRNGSSSMILADLDTDGDLDYVSDNFWRSNDGTGQFGEEQFMFSPAAVDKLLAADFDGDGDLDIIVSLRGDGVRQLKSFQNLDGQGRFGHGITLPTSDSSRFTLALEAGDFDGDGDLDLIEGGDAPTHIFINTDGQGDFQLAASNAIQALSISVYDVDDDGMDEAIVVTRDGGVAALELVGGQLQTRRQFGIERSREAVASDVNRDGVVDFFVAADNEILWLESNSDLQLSLRQSIPVTDSNVIASMRTADITGDGNKELVVNIAYDGHLTDWYRYQNDAFLPRQMVDSEYVNGGGSRTGIAAGDVSGDGVADIVFETGWKSYDAATDALTDERAVSPPHVESVTGNVILMDVDLDGDVDLVSAYTRYDCGPSDTCGMWVAWHENVDGAGKFSSRRVIEQVDGHGVTRLLEARDMDADGDHDLLFLVSGPFDDQLRWLENEDGMGTFGPSQVIQEDVRQVSIGDLNGNGLPDMLQYRNRVLELTFDVGSANPNDDPLTFDAAGRSNDLLWNPLQDWNGDGKIDILAVILEGQTNIGTIVWYENLTTDTGAAFAAAEAITPLPSTGDIGFYDLNSDGLLDLLMFNDSFSLEWRQNIGMGQFLAAQQIAASFRAFDVGDVDADGDLDLFGAVIGQQAAWLINDGELNFETALGRVNERVVTHADVDGDGDLDAFSGSLKWWENRLLGDSNGDGIFDSSDLVTVLQAGQYEDWIDGNSTFAEGDWNGDGDFTSGDLVLALQTGNYVAADRPRASDVAAAIDAMFTRDDDANFFKSTAR